MATTIRPRPADVCAPSRSPEPRRRQPRETAARDNARVERLSGLVRRGGVVVLSGAGLSTESGIPDYRGPSGLQRRATPMTYQTFTGDPVARRRYWARSYLGWRTIAGARAQRRAPRGRRAAARAAWSPAIITQNVDGLHQAGGADDVIELHGGLDRVVCLDCGDLTARDRARRAAAGGQPGLRGRAATGDQPRRRRRPARRAGRRRSGRSTAGPAAGCSSPTWCSSARRCRRTGSRRCFALVERAARAAGAGLVADGDVGPPVRAAAPPSSACRSRSSTRGRRRATSWQVYWWTPRSARR